MNRTAGKKKRPSSAANRNPPKPYGSPARWNGPPSRRNRAEPLPLPRRQERQAAPTELTGDRGPMVRIHLPPAESPRLAGFPPPQARSRLFARVCGPDRRGAVGRDGHRGVTSRRQAGVSLFQNRFVQHLSPRLPPPNAGHRGLQRIKAPCSAGLPRMAGYAPCGRRLTMRRMGEDVESPRGLSPPGAPRSVLEPLDSYGSRCSAVSMTELPVGEEYLIYAA